MFLVNVLLSAIAAIVAYTLWHTARILLKPLLSPLRDIPGPPSSSWFYGSTGLMKAGLGEQVERWAVQYGHVFRVKFPMGSTRLVTLDTKAIHHILSHSYDYPKPERGRRVLSRIFGAGLLVVEGEEHKRQKRIMNPAFGPIHLREMTSIFFDKAIQLRDIWLSQIPTSGEPAQLDALSWLSRMTLDVIGLAGFGYNFEALNTDQRPNELNQAFATIFQSQQNSNAMSILLMSTGLLWILPTERSRRIKEARKTMDRIGKQLLEEKKKAVRESMATDGKVEKKAFDGQDLLSLLVKANMAEDIPENQRLTDDQVLAQVPTFMIAGHETSSTGVTWALYALSVNPSAQSKLRSELFAVSNETPSMDELNALPYLDAVVREMLRVHPPVPGTMRVAGKDDIIPLNKPFVDKRGREQSVIRVSKGDVMSVSIVPINRSKEIWGEDGHEFKPERWLTHSIPDAATAVPGIWGNVLSFLGGPRACIGYRFSLVEMKAIIFTLIRAFEFELAVPKEEIGKKSMIVTRPMLLRDPKKNQLPLLVRPVRR
ncbi:cytochrome P450 [Neolentinus lepideus HHB14362 ss-1]|uniref:Cytochrome P450 n=1 Tax=Neolentinus lepideus HHB14362 ss-1 TaxID=1314782 RepID=A0A165MR31_9AGAM|nr:cytochrome P450 [Neolentinus lepideus HHB14362 ss-1]